MMKKLYIIPKTESFILDMDVKFLSGSEGDDDDWGAARQRGGYYHDDRNATRNGNQRGNKGWGSLW